MKMHCTKSFVQTIILVEAGFKKIGHVVQNWSLHEKYGKQTTIFEYHFMQSDDDQGHGYIMINPLHAELFNPYNEYLFSIVDTD